MLSTLKILAPLALALVLTGCTTQIGSRAVPFLAPDTPNSFFVKPQALTNPPARTKVVKPNPAHPKSQITVSDGTDDSSDAATAATSSLLQQVQDNYQNLNTGLAQLSGRLTGVDFSGAEATLARISTEAKLEALASTTVQLKSKVNANAKVMTKIETSLISVNKNMTANAGRDSIINNAPTSLLVAGSGVFILVVIILALVMVWVWHMALDKVMAVKLAKKVQTAQNDSPESPAHSEPVPVTIPVAGHEKSE